MSNVRRLRLHQVSREFKVGLNTIIDFLDKKGIKLDNSPSTIIEPNVYAVLDKEFGGNRGGERDSFRERISLKQESVSLDDKKEGGAKSDEEFKDEVIIKSGVISVKSEVAAMKQTPKILGKIDIATGKPVDAAPAPKPDPAKVAPAPAPAPKPAASEVAPEPVKAAPVAQPAPAAEAPSVPSAPAAPAPGQPEASVQQQTYDERVAADDKNIFRPGDGEKLAGPKVLGKIDVGQFSRGKDSHGRREKRKRITKDKVDLTATPASGARPQGGQRAGGPGGPGGQRAGGPGQGGGRSPFPRDNNKKKGGRPAPRPAVHTEVSD